MPLLSLAASHHELDLDALDRLSAGAGSIARVARSTCQAVVGAVVLATCNRFELYVDVESSGTDSADRGVDHAADHLARLVASSSGVTQDTARAALRVRTGPEVARHLFAVAAGLDSMVVGEREIAGQVKRALATARGDGTTSKTLELLFQTASRTSKRVANSTEVGAAGRSLVGVGLDLAADRLPGWPRVRALLLGTGSYAGAAFAALRGAGCADVRVYSTSGRAAAFAQARDAQAVTDLVAALRDADIVVACSGASARYVLDADTLARARGDADTPARESGAGRGGASAAVDPAAGALAPGGLAPRGAAPRGASRPLVILDLALRRDVDPAVAGPDVTLLDLTTLGEHAPEAGPAAVAAARRMAQEAADEFEETRLGREADAAVVALLDAAEERIAAEVAQLLAADGAYTRGMDTGPDPERATALAREVRRRVHAELHPRIVQIRSAAISRLRARDAVLDRR